MCFPVESVRLMLHDIFIIREDGVVVFSKQYTPNHDAQVLIDQFIERIAEKENLIVFKNILEAILPKIKIIFFTFFLDEGTEIIIIISVDLNDSSTQFRLLLQNIARIFEGVFLDIRELGSVEDYTEFETNLDEILQTLKI